MNNRFLITALLFVPLFVSSTSSLYAVDASAHLEKQLAMLQSFTADFNQRVIDVEQTRVDPSFGTMSFKRPGKFIWSYQEPYEQEIVSDGEQLWIYDKDLEQVTIRQTGDQLTQTPITILDNPASIHSDYKIELLSELGSQVEIQLTPLDEEAAFNYVILIFNEKGLVGMEIYDSFDHYNSLTFNNIDLHASLDDSLFDFETPDGVDVIHATE